MMRFRNCAAALAAFGLFTAGTAVADTVAKSPVETFVQENIEKAYAVLNNPSLSRAERSARFRSFMLSLTDTDRVGRFTLGRYANTATPDAVTDFEKAFADYAIAIYESRLGEFRDLKMTVTGSAALGTDDTVVAAVATGPGLPNPADPIRVGFRIRKDSGGRLILTDMEVEGIWLALWERADFTGYLQQHGGDVAELTRHLKTEATQLAASP